MARPEKVAQVDLVTESITAARSVVLSDLTGLDVAKITELRRRCRAEGVELRVVKNTLAKRGIKDTPAAALEPHFRGPTAIAISRDTENVAAKVLVKFAEEFELPKFKAAFLDGNVIDATGVLALAKLPSKPEMLAQLLGGIQGPARNLLGVMEGPLRNLLSVMKQASEKQS
ncbi:MAG: 50S ribosomal protein L10 [Candidatus Krumholzibacteria bacterium]|nr:50S ribosomal protein L10 [Candidatus Krumholzibacteria bacterium]MDH5271266.1 50S ribosomal protein L10 [Candidatus Krumholzibacteria bacterium]